VTVLTEAGLKEVERRLSSLTFARDWRWIDSRSQSCITDGFRTIATLAHRDDVADIADFICEARNKDIQDLIDTIRALQLLVDSSKERP
jgi:hypothetical protein